MKSNPLRTSVIGSYPFPGWLELTAEYLDRFGASDLAEAQDDAVVCALHDQTAAGLDVVTDGEQTRLDFNLSFYGFLEGVDPEAIVVRRFGPTAHDQRGRHRVVGELKAPRGLGVVQEFSRLKRLHAARLAAGHADVTLKASVPGPYTLSGRLIPSDRYPDRWALTEALVPVVRAELDALVAEGCRELSVDEPSMSCYAYREDPKRFVDIFNRTVAPIVGKTRVCTHLCFGNYKARPVGPRRVAPMFPAFLDFTCDELHVEMASREFSELDCIAAVSERMDAAVGVIDVKSSYVETAEDVADRVRLCLRHAPADRLVLAPDCGLSQTARGIARQKLVNMVAGVRRVRRELGLE